MTTFQLSRHERLTLVREEPDVVEVEAFYDPGGRPPPPHYHPAQDEHFEVLAGEVRVRTPDGERGYRAGESFDIPRGMRHAIDNAGSEPASVRWQVRPPLRTTAFWASVSRARTPFGRLLAVLRHRHEIRLARIKGAGT